MKRNTTTLFLNSLNATTPIAWVNNQPDFTSFTEPTLSVLQKTWQDFLDSGEELEIISDPEPYIEPPQAQWDQFNAQMLTNPRFNQVSAQCFSIAPMLASSVPTALAQVTTNGVSSFALVWTDFCQIGGATLEDRQMWGTIASQANLPQDFIDILSYE